MVDHGWTLAHVVGMRPPGLLSWLAAIALFGGLFGVIVRRGRVRIACVVVSVAGLAGTIYDLTVRSERPTPPDFVMQLISPQARTTTPLLVKVCGRTAGGIAVSPIADGRFLLVRVDGVQVGETHQAAVLVPVHRGRHVLSVEITSSGHQEFQPALTVERTVEVTGQGGTSEPSCPG